MYCFYADGDLFSGYETIEEAFFGIQRLKGKGFLYFSEIFIEKCDNGNDYLETF